MDDGLKEHIRYPEDLFRVQTNIYGTYHMTEPQVFYNKEDIWRTPSEIYGSGQMEMMPYYIILKLPGSEKEGFFLIIPLTILLLNGSGNKDSQRFVMVGPPSEKIQGAVFLFFDRRQKVKKEALLWAMIRQTGSY